MAEWEHPTGVPHGHHSATSGNSVIECVWKLRSRLRGAPSPLLARARTAYPLPALSSRGRCRLRRLPVSTMPIPHCKIPRQLTIRFWGCDGRKFPSDRRPHTRLRSCSFALEIPTFEQYVSPRGRLGSIATACSDHVPALLLPELGSRHHMSPGSRCPMPVVLSAFRHGSLARRDCSLLHSLFLLLLASRLPRYCC